MLGLRGRISFLEVLQRTGYVSDPRVLSYIDSFFREDFRPFVRVQLTSLL